MRPDLSRATWPRPASAPEVPAVLRGLRDNLFRIVALDRTEPTVLWSLDANDNPDKLWNDDWDGAALVIGDYLLEGGLWFYVVRLNRHYDVGSCAGGRRS